MAMTDNFLGEEKCTPERENPGYT